MRSLILFLMLSGLWSGSSAEAWQEAQDGDVEQGQFLYNDRGCYQCHNSEGYGSAAGARLAPDPIPYTVFSGYVREPSGQMPPYTVNVLSDSELADIYAFLESIPDPPPVESIPALNDD